MDTHWSGPLAERFPQHVRKLQPMPLVTAPTPVTRLMNSHYVKRDDLSSPLFGGNKARKLEFLLPEVRRRGARTILTMGGSGSNHVAATAVFGRELGIRTVGVVFPQPPSAAVDRNLGLSERGEVELLETRSRYLLPAAVAAASIRIAVREKRLPFLLSGGGSSVLGTLGFVNAGMELAEQIRRGEMPLPRRLFVPWGTGGTAAGIALGVALSGLETEVVAVRVVDMIVANSFVLGRLVRRTARVLGIAPDIADQAKSLLKVDHRWFGGGYGRSTSESEDAIRVFAKEGLALESTYSGKAAAAFLDAAKDDSGPLLFWLTCPSIPKHCQPGQLSP